jgi:hypothetical protein
LNYDFCTDRLAIGTTPETDSDIQTLIAAGVTHVINCRAECDIYPLIENTGLVYLWDGTEDWIPGAGQHKGVPWFQQGVEFALPVLAKPRTKVYVFCHMGANRSATMAWTILRAFGLTATECFAVVDLYRLIAIPGLLECEWWRQGEKALQTLGYL